MIDFGIVLAYFVIIFTIGLRARASASVGPEEYFLSSRSLRWPSIAMSTIATNISAGHFLSVAGAAYVDGLAQGNFELNAIFGIVIAAFFFVPLYLRLKVVTITQFFEQRFGPQIALAYAILMIALYALLYLGTALFWAAFALDGIFSEMVAWISDSEAVRLMVLIVALGIFSAVYTYMGGLRAVVRTDRAQFVLLLGGGLVTLSVAVHQLGGWAELFSTTGHLMHLHLPRDHATMPWTALIGMSLLNLNYWGANQVILQRALAAKSLRHAQVGLLVGGVLKYVMLLIIVIPGIAMAGILADAPLDDPDTAYMTLVTRFLPAGLRGLVVCGLFASLMSTVDSIFNSVSTLWSIDIYKRYLRPDASPQEIVRMGKSAIVGALVVGLLFAFLVVFLKTGSLQEDPLTHWFNELSYYVKNGFVVLVSAAVFLIRPSRKLVLGALLASIAMYFGFTLVWPETSYLVRSGWVILLSFGAVAVPTIRRQGWRIPLRELIAAPDKGVARFGAALFASLVVAHILFH
jgi:SSS family solute:Na+ symporter